MRRKKRNSLTRLVVFDPRDEGMEIGGRKLALTIYVLHRVWMAAFFEIFLWLAIRQFTNIAHSEFMELIKLVNELFLIGSGGALGIYTAGNVGAYKYTAGSAAGVALGQQAGSALQNGNGEENGGEQGEDGGAEPPPPPR